MSDAHDERAKNSVAVALKVTAYTSVIYRIAEIKVFGNGDILTETRKEARKQNSPNK
jgi:hypothetical protein